MAPFYFGGVMLTEQQERCIWCRWCCENEMVPITNCNDNILHVAWLKGARQLWIPWAKKWMVIIPNAKCKHISEDGCAIYNDFNVKPYICGTWICRTPIITYRKLIPILEKASQRILDRKFKNWKRYSGETSVMENKRVIIGLGSGRCGTSSLATLLNAQFDSCVTHEEGVPLPWNAIDRHYHINRETILNYPHKVTGDVAFWWLRYTGNLVKDFPNIKMVCLKRDKKDTVKSMIKCSNIFGSNHYTSEFSGYYDHNKWPLDGPDATVMRSCFPKYNLPLEEAIGAFYDEYYMLAEKCEKALPDNFKIFPMDYLNTQEGVIEILRFCEFQYPVVLNVNIQKEITQG